MKKRTILFISIVLFIAVLGLIYSIYLLNGNNDLKLIPNLNLSNIPSSKPLTKQFIQNYTVSNGTYPKYITINRIGLENIPVISLGLLANGSIATPDNVFETGWYKNSALPGNKGAMFIYGHVSSWTSKGVFYNLKYLTKGDLINITNGEGKIFRYIVQNVRIYPYNSVNMNQVLSPINPNLPGLNLMTCTGSVIKGTSEFNQRLVVFASLSS